MSNIFRSLSLLMHSATTCYIYEDVPEKNSLKRILALVKFSDTSFAHFGNSFQNSRSYSIWRSLDLLRNDQERPAFGITQ